MPGAGEIPVASTLPVLLGEAASTGSSAVKVKKSSQYSRPHSKNHRHVKEHHRQEPEMLQAMVSLEDRTADIVTMKLNETRQMDKEHRFWSQPESESQVGAPDQVSVSGSDAASSAEGFNWRKIVAEQWKKVGGIDGKGSKTKDETQTEEGSMSGSAEMRKDAKEESMDKSRSSGVTKGNSRRSWFGRSKQSAKEGESNEEDAEKQKQKGGKSSGSMFNLPETFEEMTIFNAKMTGANESWIRVLLNSFEDLVVSVVNRDDGRLGKQAGILAIRIHKETTGRVSLKEFRVCMLASLRSMLPKIWNIPSENAWDRFWHQVESKLTPCLDLPGRYEKPVERFVTGLDDQQFRELGLAVFDKMFAARPKSEDYFKQSNERLCFIARKAFEFSMEILQEPKRTVDILTGLGLKHIMFGIPEQYFAPFVECCMEAARERCTDSIAVEGLHWSMLIVAAVMVNTIEDGSNPLITAVLKNNPKQVRRELSKCPRSQRAGAALGSLTTKLDV